MATATVAALAISLSLQGHSGEHHLDLAAGSAPASSLGSFHIKSVTHSPGSSTVHVTVSGLPAGGTWLASVDTPLTSGAVVAQPSPQGISVVSGTATALLSVSPGEHTVYAASLRHTPGSWRVDTTASRAITGQHVGGTWTSSSPSGEHVHLVQAATGGVEWCTNTESLPGGVVRRGIVDAGGGARFDDGTVCGPVATGNLSCVLSGGNGTIILTRGV